MGYEWGTGKTFYYCNGACKAWVEIKKNPEPDDDGCPRCGYGELLEEKPDSFEKELEELRKQGREIKFCEVWDAIFNRREGR